MLIAKENQLLTNTITLDSGSTSDDPENLIDPDYSYNVTEDTAFSFGFNCGSVTSANYVAVHGIARSSRADITINIATGTTGNTVQTVTIPYYYSNVVFYFESPITDTLFVNFSITNTVTVSYIAAGEAAVVPNGGVTGGQVFPVLQNNKRASNTKDKNASPTNQIVRSEDPLVNLNFPNILRSWLESNIFDIYDLSNETGIVSMLEFDVDNYQPYRAWAAYGLQPTRISADPRLATLNTITLPFRASV